MGLYPASTPPRQRLCRRTTTETYAVGSETTREDRRLAGLEDTAAPSVRVVEEESTSGETWSRDL
jgi:hypothetical protein